jgi:hypothetical protein
MILISFVVSLILFLVLLFRHSGKQMDREVCETRYGRPCVYDERFNEWVPE